MKVNVNVNKVVKVVGIAVAAGCAAIEAFDKQKQADVIKDLVKRVAELENK